jgi:hypothetical protein
VPVGDASGNIEIAQQQREHGPFGDSSDERRHWRRRTFVHIWRPKMKWNYGQLKSDSGDDQCHPRDEQCVIGHALSQLRHARKFHSAQIGIDQRHAKQKKRGGTGRQDQVLNTGFKRARHPEIGNHCVQ